MESVKKIKSLEHIKLAIIFVALNMLDALLTSICLNAGGAELNPIMRYFFEQPKWVAWAFEIGSTLVVAFGFLLLAVYSPRFIKAVFVVSIIIMAAVCLYNGIGLLS